MVPRENNIGGRREKRAENTVNGKIKKMYTQSISMYDHIVFSLLQRFDVGR